MKRNKQGLRGSRFLGDYLVEVVGFLVMSALIVVVTVYGQ